MLLEFKDDLAEKLADDEFALKWVRHRHSQMKKFRETYEDGWKEDYKQYMSYLDPRKQDWQSRGFIPRTFDIVETILPRLVAGMFSTDPFFALRPKDERQAETMKLRTQVLQEQTENSLKLQRKSQEHWFRNALIFGTSPSMVSWDHQRRNVSFKIIDVMDWWCDPHATSMDDARDACHRVRVSVDDIKAKARAGVYPLFTEESIKKLQGAKPTDFPSFERQQLTGKGGDVYEKADDRLVTLLEYWTPYRVITCDESGQLLLRNVPNVLYMGRGMPYVLLRNHHLPEELYGMSVPTVVRNLQDQLNDIHNLAFDSRLMAMSKMFAAPRDLDLETVAIFPGAVFQMADPSLFRVIDIPDVGPSSDIAEKQISSDIDRTVGVFDASRGQRGPANETATGLQLITQEANQRFAMLLSVYSQPVLDVMRKTDTLNQIWFQLPAMVRVREDQETTFIPMSEGDYDGEVDVVIASASTLGNKDVQRMQFKDLVTTCAQVPQLDQRINWDEMTKELIDKYEIPNGQRLRKSPEQMQMEQLQAQQMALGEGVPPGGQDQQAGPARQPPKPGGVVPVPGSPPNNGTAMSAPLPIPGPEGNMRGRVPAM